MTKIEGNLRIKPALKLSEQIPVEVGNFLFALAPIDDQLHAGVRMFDGKAVHNLPSANIVQTVFSALEVRVHAPFFEGERVHLKRNGLHPLKPVPFHRQASMRSLEFGMGSI